MADTYRPGQGQGQTRDRPPPLADRITFTSGGGSSYRPGEQSRRQHNGSRTANNSEFTFSSDHQAPHFAPTGPAADRGGRRNRSRGGASGRYSERDNRRNADSYIRGGNNMNGFRRGPYRKPQAHERALLQSRDDSTEHFLGVLNGQNKFRKLEDISDDEEADMDLSSSGDGAADDPDTKHKSARMQSSASADGNSVPKWSNPDPYTVLPPPEETTGKKKDFITLIRKAKNEIAENSDSTNAVAANDDFISFGDDGDDEDGELVTDDVAPPLPPWSRNSQAGKPLTGSMNDTSLPLAAATRGAKRSAEAAGLPERPQHPGNAHKRKRDDRDNSGLAPDWQPKSYCHPAPWAPDRRNAYLSNDPFKWLHNEILDFYDYVMPQRHEDSIRQDLIDRIQGAIGRQHFSPIYGSIRCFGSFPAGLYLPKADMDLVYASDQLQRGGPQMINCHKRDLYNIAKKLERKGIASKVLVIAKAKVPIIKFVDTLTELPVDISFENFGGVDAQRYFHQWSHDYPDMVYLVALIKQFLVMRGLNEVNTGGLGGFSTICLCVSFIQLHPKPDHLGELLINFLDYYGNKFDLSRHAIEMDPPAIVNKGRVDVDGRQSKPTSLSIRDPGRADNNISGGSHRVRNIFRAFSYAHQALTQRMEAVSNGNDTSASILESILGGDYSSYEQHRTHMRNLKDRDQTKRLGTSSFPIEIHD